MRAGLPRSLDPAALATALPRFRHYFRYPLHARDFHPLHATMAAPDHARLLGYYSAKPLYGTTDAHGRVDRSAGFNGQVVAVFVPSPARSWKHVRLVHARMPSNRVVGENGNRNWPLIRHAAERAIRRTLR